jgi:hypothetical protein
MQKVPKMFVALEIDRGAKFSWGSRVLGAEFRRISIPNVPHLVVSKFGHSVEKTLYLT